MKVKDRRSLVIGDIHGAYKALLQVLERACFNPQIDTLITLGDVVDGYPEITKCIDLLINLPNKILLKGNHELSVETMLTKGTIDYFHLAQGGLASFNEYNKDSISIESSNNMSSVLLSNPNTEVINNHLNNYYSNLQHYFIDDKKRLFVHGGIVIDKTVYQQNKPEQLEAMLYDREMFELALEDDSEPLQFIYHEIFIGHTPTTRYNSETPIQACEVYNLDTGAGLGKRLSIMDVDTKQYWQSDLCADLYQEYSPRG
ncbi:metallophosphoesterase [Ancylomarina sp. YFZ004]